MSHRFFDIILHKDKLLQAMLDLLPPADLVVYSRISRSCRATYHRYCKSVFAVERLLKEFFSSDDVSSFRALQETTGVTISGSSALALAGRRKFFGADLDLYVQGDHCEEVSSWIVSHGYSLLSTPERYPTPQSIGRSTTYAETNAEISREERLIDDRGPYGPGVCAVFDFIGLFPIDDHRRKVQLIVCSLSVVDTVLRFHSTVVMNFITSRAIYCLYPASTFSRFVSYYRPGTTAEHHAREKYVRRGWDMQCIPEPFPTVGELLPGVRLVGDPLCWVIPLTLPHVAAQHELVALLSDPVRASSWMLTWDKESIDIRLHIVKSPHLKFHFTQANPAAWFQVLQSNFGRVLYSLWLEGRDLSDIRYNSRFSEAVAYAVQYIYGNLTPSADKEIRLMDFLWGDGRKPPVGGLFHAADLHHQVSRRDRRLTPTILEMKLFDLSVSGSLHREYCVTSTLDDADAEKVAQRVVTFWDVMVVGTQAIESFYVDRNSLRFPVCSHEFMTIVIHTSQSPAGRLGDIVYYASLVYY